MGRGAKENIAMLRSTQKEETTKPMTIEEVKERFYDKFAPSYNRKRTGPKIPILIRPQIVEAFITATLKEFGEYVLPQEINEINEPIFGKGYNVAIEVMRARIKSFFEGKEVK